MSSVLITQGTQTSIATDAITGTNYQIVKLDYGAAGASTPFTGTIPEITNLTKGTITALATGTLTGGTLQNLVSGTINGGTLQQSMVPVVIGTSLATVGTAGAGLWGTLVAASGAGTKQYVSGVQIIGVSGTVEVAITNIGVGGSTGAGVLARGFIPPSGGIAENFNPVQVSGTNGTLSYWMGGAGTVDITIQYWQGV